MPDIASRYDLPLRIDARVPDKIRIMDAKNAEFAVTYPSPAQAEKAATIVVALNSHDAMAALLREILAESMDAAECRNCGGCQPTPCMYKRAETLLADIDRIGLGPGRIGWVVPGTRPDMAGTEQPAEPLPPAEERWR